MGMKHLTRPVVGAVAGVVVAASLTAVTSGPAAANGNCVTYWMAGGAWSGAPAAGGTGTSADPYLVGSETDLAEVEFCRDRHFRQIADISLTPGWNPLSPFSGVYDGATHAIDGLSVDDDNNDLGLFETLQGALISNVNLTSATVAGNFRVGLLAGTASDGTVMRRVTVQGAVTADGQGGLIVGRMTDSSITESGTSGSVQGSVGDMGGIVGYVGTSDIRKVAVSVTVDSPAGSGGIAGSTCDSRITKAATAGTITGGISAGGIVGVLDCGGWLTKSASSADVTGDDYVGGGAGIVFDAHVAEIATEGTVSGHDSVGGILGRSSGGPLSDSAADATVTGHTDVGGAIGRTNTTVDKVVASGTVTASGDHSGALAGQVTEGWIKDSAASGDVTSSGGSATGGLAGSVSTAVVRDSSASGDVTNKRAAPDSEATRTGGLVGCLVDGSVHRSSATGSVTADHGSEAGGLVGSAQHSVVESSLARGNVHTKGNAGGLIGEILGTPGRVADSYARGDVAATGTTSRVGGLIGKASSDPLEPSSWWRLSSNYATGSVSDPDTDPGLLGGLVGGDTLTQLDSFWSSTANPALSGGTGTAKSSTELRSHATYADAGWDIQIGGGREDAVWAICVPSATSVNGGYAFLSWEHAGEDPLSDGPGRAHPGLRHRRRPIPRRDRHPRLRPPLPDHRRAVFPRRQRLAQQRGTSGSFTITGLTNGTTYRVRVRAINAIGPSPASNAKSGTPTAGSTPQTNLHATARAKHRALPIGKRSKLVKSVTPTAR
ncbi:MAG: GLUG motif-containing protein [Candidatus Nanopelagicales bacterium]